MDVSVILVSYNTKELTKNCLKSVFKNTKDINFEVFVVDNNSHDGSPDMIEEEFSQVHLIRNTENKGFGSANNIAIRLSNSKYIFCLNTDTVLTDNAIKQFFDFMEEGENQKVGACGARLINGNNETAYFGGKYPSLLGILFKIFCLDKLFPSFYTKHYRVAIKDEMMLSKIDYISGADLFMRKSVLDETGLFDENFFLYYEETDLCKRIHNAGYRMKILENITIIHLEQQSSINTKKQKINAQSQCYYFKKHSIPFVHLLLRLYYKLKHVL